MAKWQGALWHLWDTFEISSMTVLFLFQSIIQHNTCCIIYYIIRQNGRGIVAFGAFISNKLSYSTMHIPINNTI